MFTSRDRNLMNIDDGPQSARQKKSRPRARGTCRSAARAVSSNRTQNNIMSDDITGNLESFDNPLHVQCGAFGRL